ncbi:hypothetical protein ACFL6Y_06800 [Elusimicrobiota bacterium]
MEVELKKIRILSIIKSALPFIFMFIGVLGGVFTFIIMPDPLLSKQMVTGQRYVAAGVFALAYTLFMLLALLLFSFLYNLLVRVGFPGLKVEFASHDSEQHLE